MSGFMFCRLFCIRVKKILVLPDKKKYQPISFHFCKLFLFLGVINNAQGLKKKEGDASELFFAVHILRAWPRFQPIASLIYHRKFFLD